MTTDERPQLTMGAVVKRTGIPADTIRAWERRYGVPRPQRTPSGRRLYSEQDLALIRQIRERDTGAAEMAAAIRPAVPVAAVDEQLAEAFRAIDSLAAERRLDELSALHDVETFVERVAWPAGSLIVTLPPAAGWLAVQVIRGRLLRLLAAYRTAEEPAIVAAGLGTSDLRSLALGVLLAREGRRVLPTGPLAPLTVCRSLAKGSAALLVEVEGILPDGLAALAPLVATVGEGSAPGCLAIPDDPTGAARLVARRLAETRASRAD